MALLAGQIESANVVYQANSAAMAPGQEKTLDDIASLMNQLSALAQAHGVAMTITVSGHAAGSIADADSYRISHARAVDAVGALQDRGVAGFTIVEDAVGVRAPDRPEGSQADRQANRRVSFSVETRALPHR
jgi:outer membrane protein OmpA-like peptidoglycan-associated protein